MIYGILGRTWRRILTVIVIALVFDVTAFAEPALVVKGSSRMEPILKKLSTRFQETHPATTINVKGGSAAAGFDALLDGSADVVMSSRPATLREFQRADRKLGKSLVAVPIASDAVVVFVRPDNPLKSITMNQIRDIFSGKVTTWEGAGVAVDGTALHQHGPACEHDEERGIPIYLYLPEDGTGPHGVLKNIALRKTDFPFRVKRHGARDLVHAVAADSNGMGYGDANYTAGVRVLGVKKSADSPAIFPTAETIRNRSYPITHYMYLYFADQPAGLAQEFLTFALSAEGQGLIAETDESAQPLSFVSE